MAKKSTELSRAERTAALMKEQQRLERRRQLTIIGVVMAVLVVMVGVGVFLMSRADKTSGSTVADTSSAYGLAIGPADAKTKVVIYEDFLCPACQYFESITRDKLQAAADAGKVQVEYRPFFFLQQFGDYSERAANAFKAVWVIAGPEAAKKFHDTLFTEQPSEEGPYHDDNWLVQQAVAAGADEAKVRPAIEDMKYKDWVTKATSAASNVRATPTVYVDGKLVEASTLDAQAASMFTSIG